MNETAAELLYKARINHLPLSGLPEAARPKTADEAYNSQDIFVQKLLNHYGGNTIGYKIACTNPLAQAQLNVNGPFYGKLLSSFCFDSPAHLDPANFSSRVVEAEFAFRMRVDLPPTTAPRGKEELAAGIEGAIPGIEIVDSRIGNWTEAGALSLIADNACNAAWVKGPLLKNWQSLDLAGQRVRVFVNKKLAREGSGSAVLGNPLNALHWLVNELASRGLGLKAGEYITTGVTTEVYMAERGDNITADFGPLGIGEVAFDGRGPSGRLPG